MLESQLQLNLREKYMYLSSFTFVGCNSSFPVQELIEGIVRNVKL